MPKPTHNKEAYESLGVKGWEVLMKPTHKEKVFSFNGRELGNGDIPVTPNSRMLMMSEIINHPNQLEKTDKLFNEVFLMTMPELKKLYEELEGSPIDPMKIDPEEYRKEFWPRDYYKQFARMREIDKNARAES